MLPGSNIVAPSSWKKIAVFLRSSFHLRFGTVFLTQEGTPKEEQAETSTVSHTGARWSV